MDGKVDKRKRKTLDKPACKYGLSCYQKNPDHHKKFKHPSAKIDVVADKDVNKNSLIDSGRVNSPQDPETDMAARVKETTSEIKVQNNESIEETVEEILQTMPKDFFDFWDFCSSLNKLNPEDAFSMFGYKLVGVYDLLVKKLPPSQKVNISCHWRYYYDTPEFQTVIMKEGEDMYHIGYFRDDPSEMPSVLASTSAALNAKLSLKGDNIFAAMNSELDEGMSFKSKDVKSNASKVQHQLEKFASEKNYSLLFQTKKIKERQKNIVGKTFHGFGIVVPVKNDVGYRPLPDSNATLKSILKRIASAKDEDQRLEFEEKLDEITANVHFANDECDYGMGLEFGIDLFCFGDAYFHNHILSILPLAYKLLKRPKYASIVEAHLKNRKKDLSLSTLDG